MHFNRLLQDNALRGHSQIRIRRQRHCRRRGLQVLLAAPPKSTMLQKTPLAKKVKVSYFNCYMILAFLSNVVFFLRTSSGQAQCSTISDNVGSGAPGRDNGAGSGKCT
jgi:hypothetical protein